MILPTPSMRRLALRLLAFEEMTGRRPAQLRLFGPEWVTARAMAKRRWVKGHSIHLGGQYWAGYKLTAKGRRFARIWQQNAHGLPPFVSEHDG